MSLNFKTYAEMAADITSTLLITVMLKVLAFAPFALAKIFIFGTITFLTSKIALLISSVLGIRSLMSSMFFQNLPFPLFKMNNLAHSNPIMMNNDMMAMMNNDMNMPIQDKMLSNGMSMMNSGMLRWSGMPRMVVKIPLEMQGNIKDEEERIKIKQDAVNNKMEQTMMNASPMSVGSMKVLPLIDVKDKLIMSGKDDMMEAATKLHPVFIRT